MTDPLMLRQLRHDLWATEQLIERCRALSAAQLELTVPGTYGTIRRTLEHIVGADESYLSRLGLPVAEPFGPDANATLERIAAHFAAVKTGAERILSHDFDAERLMPTRRGPTPAWVMVTQFVHHGSDHRAHIGTILGAHGLDAPEFDVWAYARAVGALPDA
jgi:uncharacterized damage-inducible protein DinB